MAGIGFITYLNALLPFMPTVPSEKATMTCFAKIVIGAGKPFDPDKLDPKIRAAMEQGAADAEAVVNMTAGAANRFYTDGISTRNLYGGLIEKDTEFADSTINIYGGNHSW
jgi:hypothetical protein